MSLVTCQLGPSNQLCGPKICVIGYVRSIVRALAHEEMGVGPHLLLCAL